MNCDFFLIRKTCITRALFIRKKSLRTVRGSWWIYFLTASSCLSKPICLNMASIYSLIQMKSRFFQKWVIVLCLPENVIHRTLVLISVAVGWSLTCPLLKITCQLGEAVLPQLGWAVLSKRPLNCQEGLCISRACKTTPFHYLPMSYLLNPWPKTAIVIPG